MAHVVVPGLVPGTEFQPSVDGLHFANYYPHEPALVIRLPLGKTLPIGDAANGLCGGMAFTVADFYEAKRPVPPDTDPPGPDTPLYKYIVQRLLDSFNLPVGVGRYLELMQPVFPDVGLGFGLPGRASVMVRDEWPRIQSQLDAGHPVPLGLIKVKSDEPEDLGKNHQVLAYGYDLNGTDLSIWLYDPNYPNNDGVNLQLSVASAQAPVPVTYSEPNESVYCFFHTAYSPAVPPAA